MIDRYSLPEMAALFTLKNQWEQALAVELKVLSVRFKLGQIPTEDYVVISRRAPQITDEILASMAERERTADHDVAAFVDEMQARINDPAARWFHQGLTSADVTDTAICMRLRDAAILLENAATNLLSTLRIFARAHADTPTAGRTHGQHAEIITFGVRITSWTHMLSRAITTLQQARINISVGKLSGACGTYTNIEPQVEQMALAELGLRPIMATQVVPRDVHADLIYACAKIGTAIENIFDNIRVMALTEVREIEEGRRPGQKGSSAMPHKRNTIKSEQFCGLARSLRAKAGEAMDNVVLLFERDISHSAPERMYFADTLGLTYYLLVTAQVVITKLVVKPARMQRNIDMTCGVMYSQTLLTALTNKGWQRDPAYKLVQQLSQDGYDSGVQLRAMVESHKDLDFTPEELDEIFDQERLLGNVGYVMSTLDALPQLPDIP